MAVGAAIGSGTAAAPGVASTAPVGIASGSGIASGVGSTAIQAVGHAAGTGAASFALPTGRATGTGTASAVGKPIVSAVGYAVGNGSAVGPSGNAIQAAGHAIGTGAANAPGLAGTANLATGNAAATGTGHATSIAATAATGVGNAPGIGGGNAVSTILSASTGAADGIGDASGISQAYARPPRRPIDTRDRHIRRSGDDYTQAFLTLLPQGQAWPKAPDSTLVRACDGLSQYWGYVDGRAGDLLERESDPRYTLELLPDWERAWGLPDACFPTATTIGERQRMLVLVMTLLGGQSRAWFQWVANWLGVPVHMDQWTDANGIVHDSSFHEWAPFMAGISHCGDTRMAYDKSGYYRWEIGSPDMRFYWTIEPGTAKVVWFRASAGQAGVDHHVEVRTPDDLACLFQRWKPAQTELIYDFSSLAAGGPMQGTP